jgi:hypothetical protein
MLLALAERQPSIKGFNWVFCDEGTEHFTDAGHQQGQKLRCSLVGHESIQLEQIFERSSTSYCTYSSHYTTGDIS